MASVFVGALSRHFAASPEVAARVRTGVEAWRDDLRAAVADRVREQLEWDEGASAFDEQQLGAAGWMALRLFAFYAERSETELPDTVPPVLELDVEWRRAAEQKFERSLYGQLLACRVWLPGDFPVTLRVPLPDGEIAEIGSLVMLADQMKYLNQRTFQADAEEIERWLSLPAESGGELIAAAQRGYAGMHAAVQFARVHTLPVVVREP